MVGHARGLRPGDVLLTFATGWRVQRVEAVSSGNVLLYFEEFPFPWLFGGNEFVRYETTELAA